MKITKYEHSCLLVEMPDRTALFDPGMMSEQALDVGKLEFLDDVIITHEHPDHCSINLLKQLVDKFPNVRIKTPAHLVSKLNGEGINQVTTDAVEGVELFDAPHEDVKPAFNYVENIGVHYLDILTDPGDSFHFNETKSILALPVQGPWGSNVDAVNLALKLKPHYVLPLHDWHWREEAREQMYQNMTLIFKDQDIEFIPLKTGEPVNIKI